MLLELPLSVIEELYDKPAMMLRKLCKEEKDRPSYRTFLLSSIKKKLESVLTATDAGTKVSADDVEGPAQTAEGLSGLLKRKGTHSLRVLRSRPFRVAATAAPRLTVKHPSVRGFPMGRPNHHRKRVHQRVSDRKIA